MGCRLIHMTLIHMTLLQLATPASSYLAHYQYELYMYSHIDTYLRLISVCYMSYYNCPYNIPYYFACNIVQLKPTRTAQVHVGYTLGHGGKIITLFLHYSHPTPVATHCGIPTAATTANPVAS